MTNQHPSLPWNFMTHAFLDPSGSCLKRGFAPRKRLFWESHPAGPKTPFTPLPKHFGAFWLLHQGRGIATPVEKIPCREFREIHVGDPIVRDWKKGSLPKGVFSLAESLESLKSLDSVESLENGRILLCFSQSGSSLETRECLNSLESLENGLF